MALQLAAQTNYGVAGTYWRVDYVHYDNRANTLSVGFKLYRDSAAAEGGKNFLRDADVVFENVTLAAMANKNPIALAYERIKALPAFSGAVDV